MGIESIGSPGWWLGFVAFVAAMLALDLGVFHRKAHAVGFREALAWSGVWIALALVFGAVVWGTFGEARAVEFLTGYVIEKSLSIDNIFVFVVIFAALGIPARYQHRVLFWGILGALVLRAAMIVGGAAMLSRFHWLMYVFGAFLVFTGIKLYLHRNRELNPEETWAMRVSRRVIPATARLDGTRFFTVENGRRLATPLFMALVLVEVSDVLFAVDSIPAIFAVTTDPFIVFTSNIFAILGLRSLFFALAGLVEKFRYLKVGLAAVLVFVGAKMMAVELVEVPAPVSLLVVTVLIAVSVVASLVAARRHGRSSRGPGVPAAAGAER